MNPPTKFRPKLNMKMLLVFVVLIGLLTFPAEFLLRGPKSIFWMGFQSRHHANFEKLRSGDSIKQAIRLLGKPIAEYKYFPREIDYRENDFSADELKKCSYFLVWINGGNWFYCVGIDQNGRIVLKAGGHS